MGHPKKPRKQYNTPSHPWNADRIKEDNRLINKYGLKNKKEVWKAESKVERYRRDARVLLGMDSEQSKKDGEQLLDHLVRLGILSPNAKLEEVLDINVEDVLRRRLQSLVHKKGLSNTVKEN
jgi:small subunit ribosomal protein S4